MYIYIYIYIYVIYVYVFKIRGPELKKGKFSQCVSVLAL